jgi:hypothetical protein
MYFQLVAAAGRRLFELMQEYEWIFFSSVSIGPYFYRRDHALKKYSLFRFSCLWRSNNTFLLCGNEREGGGTHCVAGIGFNNLIYSSEHEQHVPV